MGRSKSTKWPLALLLAAPLLAICTWLVVGAVNRSQGPSALIPGLPPPEADLPADRLEERVDGAAESLRKNGCKRLVAWKLSSPPADLEVYVFGDIEGAKALLDREAGSHLDPAPGDEASVTAQAILFRRGVFYAKLIADPAAAADPEPLMTVAANLDRALSGASGARLLALAEPSRR